MQPIGGGGGGSSKSIIPLMKIVQGFENVNDPNGISIEKIFDEYLRVYDKFEVSFKIPDKRIIKVNGFSSVRSLGLGSFHSWDSRVCFFRDEDGRT